MKATASAVTEQHQQQDEHHAVLNNISSKMDIMLY